jgi:hypothetical protein
MNSTYEESLLKRLDSMNEYCVRLETRTAELKTELASYQKTDWQGIAIDRGRALQDGARRYAELAHPEVTDGFERAKLAKQYFEQWLLETETHFSKMRREAGDDSTGGDLLKSISDLASWMIKGDKQ